MAKKVFNLVIDDELRQWATEWADKHCEHHNEKPNVSKAINMALQFCQLVDNQPELKEIINKEFDGDYRMFLRRAAWDYQNVYEETQLGQQFTPPEY